MDANQMAAAGFYFTNQSDFVRCVYCGVEIGYWTEGDIALKELRRWIPSCSFVKVLCFGKIPIPSNGQPEKSPQASTRTQDLCGSHCELRANLLPERSKYY